jgi:hypothetical protein
MREFTICNSAGFPQQLITFQSIGQDPVTSKTIWKPIDENDKPRKYKYNGRPISNEDVLFLLPNIIEIGHIQVIEFPLSLQQWLNYILLIDISNHKNIHLPKFGYIHIFSTVYL